VDSQRHDLEGLAGLVPGMEFHAVSKRSENYRMRIAHREGFDVAEPGGAPTSSGEG
jgi:hypothetical protein